jgi:hypothetical protein
VPRPLEEILAILDELIGRHNFWDTTWDDAEEIEAVAGSVHNLAAEIDERIDKFPDPNGDRKSGSLGHMPSITRGTPHPSDFLAGKGLGAL